jgi:ferredoxin
MRSFPSGAELWIEPWRALAFPVLRDLVVDRSAFDRIIQAGGFISVNTGSPPDANALPIPKDACDTAMDAAACIGCGACVAACPNASSMLFVAAKVTHLASLPQGQVTIAITANALRTLCLPGIWSETSAESNPALPRLEEATKSNPPRWLGLGVRACTHCGLLMVISVCKL